MRYLGKFIAGLLLVSNAGTALSAEPPPPPDTEESTAPLAEVIVTGTASPERTRFESSVAVSTFSAEDIAQKAPSSTADLISSVPGFFVESTSGSTQGNVFARGIIQDGGYRYVGLMEDGIPLYPVFELSFYNPDQFVRLDETIERVEALRGGTAPIFTSGAIGGAINFVTRDPGESSSGTLKTTISDYGLYQVDGFWGGPISDEWGLAVGGYYRESDGIRDPGYTADRGGQLRFKLTRALAAGDLEIFGKYIDDRSLFAVPLPMMGSPSNPTIAGGGDPGEYSLHSKDIANAGLPASAAEVGLQGSDLEDGIHPQIATLGARISWEFSDTVSLASTFRFTDGDVRFDGIFPGDPPVTARAFAATRGVAPNFSILRTGAAFNPDQLVQNHGHWVVDKEFEAVQNDARLRLVLDAHDVTVGLYLADYSMSDRWSLGNLLLLDVTDGPNRLSLPGVTDPQGFTQYSFFNLAADYDATAVALYVADEWQLTDALRIDLGVRYDTQDTDTSISNGMTVNLDGNPATLFDNATALAGSARTNDDFSFNDVGWSVGFNYELNRSNAVFAHFTRSAKLPHFDDLRNGVRTKDEVDNIELGYKVSLRNLGVFVTLFETTFDNVPFNDILAGGATARRRAGTRTRGIELEGSYFPIEPLSINFAITLQDPEYTDFSGANIDNTGNQIRRIPESIVRITPAFSFAGDRARVFATYSRIGQRFSNDENTINLPSYEKLDLGVQWFASDKLTVQLTGDNLTDEVGLTEGNPRTDLGAAGIGALYNARPLFGRSYQAAATWRF
jgi:outer membrane receptor protein involved in Fe transport